MSDASGSTPGPDEAERTEQVQAGTSNGGPHDAPRIADLPPPRRTRGLIGPLFRWVFAWPYRLTLKGLLASGIHAWHLTVLSLVANVVIGILIVQGYFFVPGLLLIVAGLLDIFDGGVARGRGEESRAGAFLDSTMDRVCDVVLFSCIYWTLSREGDTAAAALTLTALVASLLVSYVRSEAEAAGISLTEGLMQRLERYVALMIALTAPGAMIPIMALLTVLGLFTVVQRGWSAWGRLPA
jgi:phosphatidylinositol phosphate synthase